MTQQREAFDLRTEPWIAVRQLDGASDQVSLHQIFDRAHELHSVTGDLPTQAFAVHRLLLAVLHRALPTDGRHPADQWRALWDAGRLPSHEIDAYLDRYADRLDLLHPHTPFFQVAGLHTAKGGTAGLASLIADVPTGHPYFTTRAGPGLDHIDYAEATRWVVHLQAFDPSGIKSGAVGDSRVKGGKGYPIGTAWAGTLGGVLVEGRSLFETLLLNLVLVAPDGHAASPPEDRPAWEREHLGPAVEDGGGGNLVGPAGLFTWQSRRLRLVEDGAGVTGVLVANGDPLTPQNRHVVEPMTSWRRSQPQEKKLALPLVYMPRQHQPERSVWRGLGALLPQRDVSGSSSGPADTLPPRVMEWVRDLEDWDAIEPELPLRTRIVGMVYGSNNSVVDDVVDDAVLLRASVVASPPLRAAAVGAVSEADAVVQALTNLAGNLAAASGGDAGPARERARELGFSRLDSPYRRWLTELGLHEDVVEHRARWQRELREQLTRLGSDLIQAVGSPAWVGREHNGRHLDSGIAEAWFYAALRRAIPLAFPPPGSDQPASSDADEGSAA